MNSHDTTPDLDEVLERFMMEADQGSPTLQRYLRDYPQYAVQLIDLSRMAATFEERSDTPLSGPALSRIDAAWISYAAASPQAPSADPFQTLTGERGKAVAKRLGVPRQVITCFREHRVIAQTVPNPVVRMFADEFDLPPAHVIAAMSASVQASRGRMHKSDGKPGKLEPVSFEEILIGAGVSEQDRARLLADV